jgi:hypothetical protein
MTVFERRLRENTETVFGALYSAGFLLAWLCCWPLYRLVRSHTIRS